jgi:Aspartyl protease
LLCQGPVVHCTSINQAFGITGNDQDKIQRTIYYQDADTAELWEGVLPATAALRTNYNWQNFKDDIWAMYPGSELKRMYTVGDLERFVFDTATKGVFTRVELGSFYREFKRMADSLMSENRLTTHDRNRLYLVGFGDITHRWIEHRLSIKLPDHHPDDVYDMTDVHDAATWILSHTESRLQAPSSPSTVPGRAPPSTRLSIPDPPKVKAEESELTKVLQNMQAALEKLTQAVEKPAPRSGQPSRACSFCGDANHFLKNCTVLSDYVNEGKCSRSQEGRVKLASSREIPMSSSGKTLWERIDNYIKANPESSGMTRTISSSLFRTSTLQQSMMPPPSARIEEIVDDEDPDSPVVMAQALVNELTRQGEKKKKDRNPKPQPVVEITRNEGAAARKRPRPEPGNDSIHVSLDPTAPKTGFKPEPQYHYQAPCENPEVVNGVLTRALDSEIKISQRELLAISMDVRRKVKDLVTAKRVPHASASAFSAPPETLDDDSVPSVSVKSHSFIPEVTDDTVVAVDVARNRFVTAQLAGKMTIEALVDHGSEVVSISKEVWQKMGEPLRSDLILCMESANGTKENTLGVLKNFPVQIGPCTFFVQMQVSEHLPVGVILGRPFFMLTGATTTDHPDGSQDLTLLDPNTSMKLTVPTHALLEAKKTVSMGF